MLNVKIIESVRYSNTYREVYLNDLLLTNYSYMSISKLVELLSLELVSSETINKAYGDYDIVMYFKQKD